MGNPRTCWLDEFGDMVDFDVGIANAQFSLSRDLMVSCLYLGSVVRGQMTAWAILSTFKSSR